MGFADADMRHVTSSSTLPGSDAVEATVMLPNSEWVVRVAPAGGWRSNYYGGLIAAVVVLAFALSLILFAALVLWRRHQMLLAALLPRKVIQDLHKAGGAALEGTYARVVLNTDTTADVMLRVLMDVASGAAPAISDVMLVRSAIARSADIYQPIIGITEQMHGAHMDRDVAGNLAQILCATEFAASLPHNITWQRAEGPGGRLLPTCAAPSSVASGDASFHGGISLPPDDDDEEEEEDESAHFVIGSDGGGCRGPRVPRNKATAAIRRMGSHEALHLSEVFAEHDLPAAASVAAAGPDDSARVHMVTAGSMPATERAAGLAAGGESAAAQQAVQPSPPELTPPPMPVTGSAHTAAAATESSDESGNDLGHMGGGLGGGKGAAAGHDPCDLLYARPSFPNVHASSSGRSGRVIRHVPGSPTLLHLRGSNCSSSASRLRPPQGAVRVRGALHGSGHHHHLHNLHSLHHSPAASVSCSSAHHLHYGKATGAGCGAGGGAEATDDGVEPGAPAGREGAAAFPFRTGSDTAAAMPGKQQQKLAMVPPRALLDEVERVLAGADGWQFDTFRLAEVSGGLPLSALGYFLMQRAGLIKTLGLSAKTLIRCLRVVEAGYIDNPYHSATHAADVLQTLHVIIHSAELNVHYLDPLGLFAAYWAAIVHDYRHPGLTGDFLIATSHPLAIRYNDRSPLENHHAASSFAVLRRRGMELLQPLPAEGRVAFRKQVIEMVMATDMKQHFALCSQFSTVHRLSAFSAERAKAAAPTADVPTTPAGGGARPKAFTKYVVPQWQEWQGRVAGGKQRAAGGGGGAGRGAPEKGASTCFETATQLAPQPLDESERLLALCVAIKAADLGHLGESLEVHKRWLAGLEEEFFRQGDQERELGMPISPLFDRAKQGVSKSQTGFYEFVGLPLVHALSSAFPGAAPLMSCFTANYQHWLRVQQEAQAQGQQ
ncbi:hypothetical protein HXX76_001156 [Chlamydomonas incerta]|uniref:PDEase domain-containing protein n=1 Tax=Chlamydomonas incerta TaxID=51695 RepID=A0A835WBT1_CHLIN|nr:hypothetical protein HXX76_001156 [Chlamydomonas incerta]|eukprot:KAG2444403.1 hypothetical protein HXX76_001156 [Chlamydomonas incerta]